MGSGDAGDADPNGKSNSLHRDVTIDFLSPTPYLFTLVVVVVEEVKSYLERGNYKRALNRALKLESPIKKLLALTEILISYPKDEVLFLMFDVLDSISSTAEKALGYSILGRALYAIERDKSAEFYFERAMEELKTISSPQIRGEVLGGIARNLVLSDRYKEGLELFKNAVEILQTSRGLSAGAVSSLIKVARLIEKSADEIPNEIALEFYKLAESVYSSINFKVQAKYLKERIELINDVLRRGKVVVDDLLEKGEVDVAMSMMRFLPLETRGLAMLELSYWLHLHELHGLGRKVFEDALEIFFVGKFPASDAQLEAIARRFLRVGFLEEALVLAGLLKGKKASELLGDIALTYARMGDVSRALSIAEGIQDVEIKEKVLEILRGGEYVGHEQGLPLTGRGEKRGAVPEDDRAREVQGKVEQERGPTAGEGDDSGTAGDEVQLSRPEGAD